jgi:hypothetical protein
MTQSAMDVITQMNLGLECVRTKLTDMKVTQDYIIAFVSQHCDIDDANRGRFNTLQVAHLVPPSKRKRRTYAMLCVVYC